MAKKKHKVARYMFALNQLQNISLQKMMHEDMQTDISSFMGGLIVKEWKEREREKNKKPIGRPRKENEQDYDVYVDDYSDDIPKNINWFGTQIGEREYQDNLNLQKKLNEGTL
jgi:hypothetical protein